MCTVSVQRVAREQNCRETWHPLWLLLRQLQKKTASKGNILNRDYWRLWNIHSLLKQNIHKSRLYYKLFVLQIRFCLRSPQRGNSLELVELIFWTMTFNHFTQRTICKKLPKHLSVLIFTRFEVIINNITKRKYCIMC